MPLITLLNIIFNYKDVIMDLLTNGLEVTRGAHTQLHVGEDKSILFAQPYGDAAAALKSEGRWFRHSNFQPTGRYAKKGTLLTIILPADVAGLEVVTGNYGPYSRQNGGQTVTPKIIALTPGVNFIEAPVDGMIYIQNRLCSKTIRVEIAGGKPVPTFIKDVTSEDEFHRQLTLWTDSPFIELIGEYVLANFQYHMAAQVINDIDINKRIAMMDAVISHTNALYGLAKNDSDFNHKSCHRLYISNPDTGAGYASATQERITFQNSTGAGRDLLAGPEHDQWGLYHEVGHTYQMSEFRWSGLTEVTVNISSLAVQEAMGYANRLDTETIRKKFADFRKTPVSERNYATINDLFLKVLMFDQLRRGFGAHFYAHLAQAFRMENAMGIPEPASDHAVQQHFMITAAKITHRNLTPFFAEWGMPLTEETRIELAKYPALVTPVWDNLDRKTDIIERDLLPLEIPAIMTSPAVRGIFDVDHPPVYRGTGIPGATITVEQGLLNGRWYPVGITTVNHSGEWSLAGSKLSAGAREARATQSNGGSGYARNVFSVVEKAQIPVVIGSPEENACFDTRHSPVYAGTGTPGATIDIEQGLITGGWYKVGQAIVHTDGTWSLAGDKLTAGAREVRATQRNGASGSDRKSFTVTEAVISPVTLVSPCHGALFGVEHIPLYQGKGKPGSTILVEQGLLNGLWQTVGSTKVSENGAWFLMGEKLSAGEREARATQTDDNTFSARHVFTVVGQPDLPLRLDFPSEMSSFDENHLPLWRGKGIPGSTIYVEQGMLTGAWYQVGMVRVDTNGEWRLYGGKLSAGKREIRVSVTQGGSGTIRRPFTVTPVDEVAVTIDSPAADASFDVYHQPLYKGRGTPGALVIIEQGLRVAAWSPVGTTTVNNFGEWTFKGQRLPVGEREVRARHYIYGRESTDKKNFTVVPALTD